MSMARRLNMKDAALVGSLFTVASIFANDMLAGASLVVLWFIWKYLRHEGGIPVLAAALTFQWMQVTIGVWYFAATGRRLDTMELSDYRPMVLIGIGCVASLAVGIRTGIHLMKRLGASPHDDQSIAIEWPALILVYVAATVLQGGMQWLAYQIPELTQPILALRFVRLATLFLVVHRLTSPVLQWYWILVIVGVEVVLGVTGYFAGFREPLVMVAISLYEAFNPRRVTHWVFTAAVACLAAALAVMWMNVRRDYRESFEDESFAASRQAQLDRMQLLASTWFNETHDAAEFDKVVDRLWTVYYPALAVSRVPAILPHTDGKLMMQALQHIFNPRLFFPTKAELQSDSEMVRKYSGVYVAGAETGTSIAFGYSAESYIDYGIPWMFVPSLFYGLMMGLAFQYLVTHIGHHELRAGLLAVVFWLSLYLFERSWVKTLGLAGTLLIYLGGPALFFDYFLGRWEHQRDDASQPDFRQALS